MQAGQVSHLRTQREAAGVSRACLARETGMSTSALAMIERGSVPGPEVALRIGTTLDRLDDGEDR